VAGGRAVWNRRAEEGADDRRRPVLARLIQMLVLMALFGAIAWWRGHRGVAVFLACFAGANLLAAAFWPAAFRLHARLWEVVGRAGALVIGTAALTLAYYVLFAPAALVLKLIGAEPLKLRFPGPPGSYWNDVDDRHRGEPDYRKQF
jgi:hypothetical protein